MGNRTSRVLVLKFIMYATKSAASVLTFIVDADSSTGIMDHILHANFLSITGHVCSYYCNSDNIDHFSICSISISTATVHISLQSRYVPN